MTDRDTDDWGLVPSDDQFRARDRRPLVDRDGLVLVDGPGAQAAGLPHPAFRANMGIQFGGVLVVDDTAVVPWELPAFEWSWHEPLTEPRTCSTPRTSTAACGSGASARSRLRLRLRERRPVPRPHLRGAVPAVAPRRERRSITVPTSTSRGGSRAPSPSTATSSRSTASRCVTGRGACGAPAASPRSATTMPLRPPTTVSSPSRSTAAATTASVRLPVARRRVVAPGRRPAHRRARRRAPRRGSTSRRSTSWAARSAPPGDR